MSHSKDDYTRPVHCNQELVIRDKVDKNKQIDPDNNWKISYKTRRCIRCGSLTDCLCRDISLTPGERKKRINAVNSTTEYAKSKALRVFKELLTREQRAREELMYYYGRSCVSIAQRIDLERTEISSRNSVEQVEYRDLKALQFSIEEARQQWESHVKDRILLVNYECRGRELTFDEWQTALSYIFTSLIPHHLELCHVAHQHKLEAREQLLHEFIDYLNQIERDFLTEWKRCQQDEQCHAQWTIEWIIKKNSQINEFDDSAVLSLDAVLSEERGERLTMAEYFVRGFDQLEALAKENRTQREQFEEDYNNCVDMNIYHVELESRHRLMSSFYEEEVLRKEWILQKKTNLYEQVELVEAEQRVTIESVWAALKKDILMEFSLIHEKIKREEAELLFNLKHMVHEEERSRLDIVYLEHSEFKGVELEQGMDFTTAVEMLFERHHSNTRVEEKRGRIAIECSETQHWSFLLSHFASSFSKIQEEELYRTEQLIDVLLSSERYCRNEIMNESLFFFGSLDHKRALSLEDVERKRVAREKEELVSRSECLREDSRFNEFLIWQEELPYEIEQDKETPTMQREAENGDAHYTGSDEEYCSEMERDDHCKRDCILGALPFGDESLFSDHTKSTVSLQGLQLISAILAAVEVKVNSTENQTNEIRQKLDSITDSNKGKIKQAMFSKETRDEKRTALFSLEKTAYQRLNKVKDENLKKIAEYQMAKKGHSLAASELTYANEVNEVIKEAIRKSH
eukprot:Tbor_TRINITY_DN4309_c0_g1::TRINITY_DN4309_c0_g1_i1::g.7641::m.7641